jgi:hypothetical protein
MHFIPRRIPAEFLQPELASIRWCRAIPATVVPMPEAAVDEDHGFVFRENNIRLSWKVLHMQTEPIPHPMQEAAHDEFRARVLATNPAHVPGTPFFAQPIAHGGHFNAKSRRRKAGPIVLTDLRLLSLMLLQESRSGFRAFRLGLRCLRLLLFQLV